MSTDIEQIKERLNIVDVISSYIKVEKAGINFKAKCPFHNEKTPSFMISPTRQSFYCFGCNTKGDIFTFVEKFEGLDFKGALESLANRAGIELKKFKGKEKIEEKDKLFEIMEEAVRLYQKQLEDNKKVWQYLERRGLSSSSITKWRLGFAKDEWRSLHDYLIQKGFSRENLLEAGLIKKIPTEDGNNVKFYDTFRNRVTFPICDAVSRVIAFSGRALKESGRVPKYLNSPETKLFYKSEVLYGLHMAKSHIRKLDYAVLVEGQMDLIMSHQAGVLNTVASSGTALTELHLKKIQKLSNRVIIAYDSDAAGEKAGRRAAELALSLGLETKIASLPKGEDPASTIKKDPKKWMETLRGSEYFLDYALNKVIKENDDRSLVREILKNVLPLALLVKSDIEKTQFIKKIALKMKVSEADVWNDLDRIGKNKKFGEESGLSRPVKAANLERIMAGIIFFKESEGKKKKTNLDRLKREWRKVAGKDGVEKILDNYKDEREALVFEVEELGMDKDVKEVWQDMLRRAELEILKRKLQETAIFLDDKSLSKSEEKKIKAEFDKIQKRIKELSN